MILKKQTRRIINIFMAFLLLSCFFIFAVKPIEVKAFGNQKITSMDDFYVKLSNQIFAHEVDVKYDIPDYDLVKKIMEMDMSDYQYHYDEEKPLISGCYLSYYIDYLNLYYRNGSLRIVIQFKYSKSDMDEHFAMMKDLAVELKRDTPYDTVQNVHDYLIKKFEYDKKTIYIHHTDIDGFKDNQMVCSGYSLAAYYLLNAAGVPTRVVTGYGGSGDSDDKNHMWNIVELDGDWYNMDITWDDVNKEKPTYTYFLKSDKDFPDHKRLGRYDNDIIKYSISEKSYKLPAKLRFGEFKFYLAMALAIVIGMILISKLFRKKREQKELETYVEYKNNDYRF